MTIEPEPQLIELRGADALQMHHMWGTNGLVLEVELALAPSHPWVEQVVTFADRDDALEYANALAHAPGVLKKNITVLLLPVPAYMTRLAKHLPDGEHAVLSLVAEVSEPAADLLIAAHRGTQRYRVLSREAKPLPGTLKEYGWNHTTLHALKVDSTLTYLQTSFTPGKHLQQVREMCELFGDEVLWHLEFIRGMDGLMTCTALPLIRFTTEERLQAITDTLRAHGVRVADPHVNFVEDGKHSGTLPAEVMELRERFDPQRLLNPGKLRSLR